MNLDKIFIINLPERTDRKIQIIDELKKQNITNYDFFDGVRPTLEDVDKWNKNYCFHNKKNVHPFKFLNYRRGCLGCLKSHIEIIKIALERNYKNILILEDDTEFIDNFDKLFEYAKEINNTYDMLYLAGSHLGTKKYVSNNVNKVIGTHTTGSYCITEKAMKYILNNIEGYDKEIDVFYAKILQPIFNCYCVKMHITRQRDGYSDIQQGNVSYGYNWNM